MTEPLPMSEQTELDEQIKVSLRMNTDARRRLNRQAEIHRADGMDPEDWAATRCVGTHRQKTNVVVRTREEAGSLFRFLYLAGHKSRNTEKALDRVETELKRGLKRQALAVNREDKYHPEVVDNPDAGGEPPAHPPFQAGDMVQVRGGVLGWKSQGGEPDETLRNVTVDTLGSEQVLIQKHPLQKPEAGIRNLLWVPYDDVESLATDAMKRQEIRESIREKREQADHDALLDLCKRHAKAEAERVWPGGMVPVDDIEFRFNPQLSYHRGFYYGKNVPKKGGFTPVIELSPKCYYNRGLGFLLEVVRHELIHAWQDYHPDGHPPDAHKHHGRDFKQWVDELNTH